MTSVPLFITIITAYFTPSEGNYYFVTHSTYASAGYSPTQRTVYNITGSLAVVTQQCRRNCALRTSCAGFKTIPLSVTMDFGLFECRIFFLNACDWNITTIRTVSLPGRVWEKLDANHLKPKACVEYCKVKYQGNCTACRGYNLDGLDCDIAPKSCSDYSAANWAFFPIWPWGFYGPKITAYCIEQRTTFLNLSVDRLGIVHFGHQGIAGWFGSVYTDVNTLMNEAKKIEWNLISELVAAAEKKELVVFMYNNGFRSSFSGLELSLNGELSLQTSLNDSQGFPIPIVKVPFVYDNTCGAFFWQFSANTSICNQRTNLGFSGFKWDNGSYPNEIIYFTFS